MSTATRTRHRYRRPFARQQLRSVEQLLDELGVEQLPERRGEIVHSCFFAPENHSNGDEHPSASSNVETRLWYCHVCGVGGVHEGYEGIARSGGNRRGGERASNLPDITQLEEYVPAPTVSDTYEYQDESGNVVFWIRREEWYDQEKDTFRRKFVPHHMTENGRCVVGLLEVRPLYRLPKMIAGVEAGRNIYIVEGEKDADAMAEAGVVATCSVGGAGKFGRAEGAHYLRGTDVVIIADRDDAGL